MDRKILEALVAGKGVNEITRDLGVGKKRVSSLRTLAIEVAYLGKGVPLPVFPEAVFPDRPDGRCLRMAASDALLLPHRAWIADRLEVGWHAVSVFEELPVRISRSAFYRFLERHELLARRYRQLAAIPEIVHEPGEALLVDWGKLYDYMHPVTGARRTVWAFVGVLGYSRYMMVRLVESGDLDTSLAALESMLRELGGAPGRLTSDNPKVFALEADHHEPLINPVYERFAGYYGTTVECLPPRRPQLKGKVERPMPYIRRLFESFGGDRSDLSGGPELHGREAPLGQ